MNAVVIEVSAQALEQAIGLPVGFRVTGIEFDSIRHVVVIRIDHPDFPVVAEGARPGGVDEGGEALGTMVLAELGLLSGCDV